MPPLPDDLARGLEGRYRIDRELGRGGMATVFLAQDLRHGRPVALKLLHPILAATLGPDRFLREVHLAARLTHPHILTVLDSGELPAGSGPPLLWYTMQYVEGESLAVRLERTGPLPVGEAVRLTRQVADAIGYAHRQGFVHRDLKPENILLADGHALVADFGIARAITEEREERLTETGLIVGTPGYMSPEQAAGDKALDGRSDLFSLGCVFYEMLTATPPFGSGSPRTRMARSLSGQFPPVESLRPEAAGTGPVLGKLLAPDPADRFPDAAALLAALDGAPAPALVSAPPSRRRPARLAALALGAVALVAALWHWTRPSSAPAGLAVVAFRPLTATAIDSTLGSVLVEGFAARVALLPGLQISASIRRGTLPGDSGNGAAVRYALATGARYVLTGAARWEGQGTGAIYLEPELLEVVPGAPPERRWGDTLTVPPAELYQAEIRIAKAVGRALGRSVRRRSRARFEQAPTRNPAAVVEYLRSAVGADSGIAEALAGLERAVGLDTAFALAWAQLGAGCSFSYRNTQNPLRRDCARTGSERAMALDSGLAQSHYAAGLYARHVLRDFPRAKLELEQAARLAPWDASSFTMLAAVLMSLGEWEAAQLPARRAQALDPVDLQPLLRVVELSLIRHRYVDAIRELDRARALDSLDNIPIYLRSLALVMQGDLDGARAFFDHAPTGGNRLPVMAARGTRYGRIWYYGAGAREALLAAGPEAFDGRRSRQLLTFAQIHWLAGRFREARAAAQAAMPLLRREAAEAPENDEEGLRLAFAMALAGDSAGAIQEGARAALLRPVSRDARNGPYTQLTFAEVLAVAGAPDSARAVLAPLMDAPGPVTTGWVSVDPWLAALRDSSPPLRSGSE